MNLVIAVLSGLIVAVLTIPAIARDRGTNFIVVPGKSLGVVHIGDTMNQLVSNGFQPDKDRDPLQFCRKGPILARLESDRVVQLWFDGDYAHLLFKKKRFPSKKDPETLRKYFRDCEATVVGSGGTLIYCENRGVELAYRNNAEFIGLSIVTPDVVKKVIQNSQ